MDVSLQEESSFDPVRDEVPPACSTVASKMQNLLFEPQFMADASC